MYARAPNLTAPLAGAPPDPRSALRQRSCDGLHLQAGQRVLDLGCGAATDTLELGRRVGPAGQVRGADYDAAMIKQAQARAQAEGQSAWVSHAHANATALPWPEGYFDASLCAFMLQHVLDPELALDEMLRVTRSGGQVLVVDIDWATLSIECGEPGIERRLVRQRCESALPNPCAGRRLPGLLRRCRLQDMQVEVWPLWATEPALAEIIVQRRQLEDEALAAGAVDTDDLGRWHASLNDRVTAQRFRACVNAVLVSGRRP